MLEKIFSNGVNKYMMIYGGIIFFAVGGGYSYIKQHEIAKKYYHEQVDKLKSSIIEKNKDVKFSIVFEDGDGVFIGKSVPHNFDIKYMNDAYSGREIYYDANTGISTNNRGNNSNSVTSTNNRNDSSYTSSASNNRGTTTVEKQSLEDLFNKAVSDTNSRDLVLSTTTESVQRQNQNSEQNLEAISIYDLPDNLRNQVPKYVYNAHNYSSDPSKRSIILNGQLLKEGQGYKNITVVKIAQNYSILRVKGQSFSVRAMEDNQD